MTRRKKKKRGRDILTCYDEWKCKCLVHNRKCVIPVVFPTTDTRNQFVSEMTRLGAEQHEVESDHRCDLCDRERQEGRRPGWYQVDKVDGNIKPKPLLERLEKERIERAKVLRGPKAHRKTNTAGDTARDR